MFKIQYILAVSLIAMGCGGSNPAGTSSSVFPPEAQNPVSFTVDGTRAIMIGSLDETTPNLVADFIADHPLVDTIVLQFVPGTSNSAVSLNAGRVIRAAGLNTTIPADGAVASGGTDVFLSGVFREVEPGGMVGVHTWQTTDGEDNVISGSDLPTSDPRHLIFKNYYREMSIPEVFYWFAIQAAPAEEIHWMTRQELSEFGVLRTESP